MEKLLKQTLQFDLGLSLVLRCNLSLFQLSCSSSLCFRSCDILSIYFPRPFKIDKMIAEYFKFWSYTVGKLDLVTMSAVGDEAIQ